MFMNNIAFDLDGTLVDLMSVFQERLTGLYPGYRMLVQDQFKIVTVPPLSNKEIWEIFDEVFPLVKQFPIYPGARELLEALYELTRDPIRVVTARPIRCAHETMALLRRIANVPFMLCMCDGHQDKISYLKGIDFYVEDRRRIAIELAEAGKAVFLIDQPWNQTMPEDDGLLIKRVDGIETLIPWIPYFAKGE